MHKPGSVLATISLGTWLPKPSSGFGTLRWRAAMTSKYTLALHLQWGLPSRSLSTSLVTLLPHRCTLTRCRAENANKFASRALNDKWRFSFLWHYPHAHAHWALPSNQPCGARTFLINAYVNTNINAIACITSFCIINHIKVRYHRRCNVMY